MTGRATSQIDGILVDKKHLNLSGLLKEPTKQARKNKICANYHNKNTGNAIIYSLVNNGTAASGKVKSRFNDRYAYCNSAQYNGPCKNELNYLFDSIPK